MRLRNTFKYIDPIDQSLRTGLNLDTSFFGYEFYRGSIQDSSVTDHKGRQDPLSDHVRPLPRGQDASSFHGMKCSRVSISRSKSKTLDRRIDMEKSQKITRGNLGTKAIATGSDEYYIPKYSAKKIVRPNVS
jgi:hypothetical protein